MGFVAKKTVHISKTIRMDKQLIDRLQKEARKAGISLNQIIVQCCQYALESVEDDQEADMDDSSMMEVDEEEISEDD